MQTRALLVCVLATLALAQAITVICDFDIVIDGPTTSGYEHCCCVNKVTVKNNALIHTIDFPTISVVFGDVIIENNPNLESIPWHVDTIFGSLSIQNNAYLMRFLPNVDNVGGDFTIANNDELYTVSMPWFGVARSLNVFGNPHLRVLDMPLLTSMQYGLTISENPLLTTLNAPILTFVGSVNVLGTHLNTLNLPALTQTENEITILNNPFLLYVEMPNLYRSYGYIEITGNFNGNTMSQFDFLSLDQFGGWSSQAVSSFTSCNSYLQSYYGAYCPTAQAVAPKPAMYPAIQAKKMTKKDFFDAKLKLAAKANTPAPK